MCNFSISCKRQFIQLGQFNLLSNFKDREKHRIRCSGLLVFKTLLDKACKICCLNAEGSRRRKQQFASFSSFLS